MQFDITEEQYAKLLRLAYLGSWMVEAHESDKQNYFKDLEQIIYSQAQNTSQKDLIEYDKELETHFPTPLFDEDKIVSEVIDQYDENCFWDELIDRLTKRDMLDLYGEEKIQNMELKERIEKENAIMSQYDEEFEENGLRNLRTSKKE